MDQLPPVGAGEVLRDLLAAGSLTVRLTRICRQAAHSGIVAGAHRQLPGLGGFGDFFWFGCEDTEQTAGLVTDIVAVRIPARFGLDPRATCRCCAWCIAARPDPGTSTCCCKVP